MKRCFLFGTSFLMGVTLPGQSVPLPTPNPTPAGAYSPKYELPAGRQLVVVFIGQTGCGFSRDPELKHAIRQMKPRLAQQADSLRRPLSLNGIALDWVVDSGVVYLHSLGAWDEITVGNNWGNLGAVRYVWREVGGQPVIPQVLVYERSVTPGKRGITFGHERRVATYTGTQEVIDWVNRGAPILAKHRPSAVKPRAPEQPGR